MDLKVLHKDDNKLIFILKDTDFVYTNTLRRIMISGLPTLAIRKVTFVKNTSAMFDEVIAHRLGLIPLTGDLDSYTLPNECTCKGAGCGKCQSAIILKAEGPLTVYASDLKCQDSKIKPAYAKIPIAKLFKGQELEFEAIVTLGTGKEHSKFSAGLVHYKGYPEIKFDKVKNPDEVANECPQKILEVEGKTINIKDPTKCILCGACAAVCDPKGSVIVEASEKDFIFTIESWGKMPPEEILSRSLDLLNQNLDEFAAQLSKAK